ncbi:hypothetical protein R3W88_033389 [Solanum pinnatisectum]|uniref:Transactivator protein n=1 Tax=Solanum pinnatisectum TaxID=50273 RepID=A0AAV9K1A6_9SOLN|nr:hypothetical protein R3W88_033389 [Solanum pinnatisectum]
MSSETGNPVRQKRSHLRGSTNLLKITSQGKDTEKTNTMDQILNLLTTLCTKVDSMDGEIQKLKKQASSQQHDAKHAELRRSEDDKIPDLEGDVGKLHKTHNVCVNTAAGTSGSTRKEKATEGKSYRNTNMNKLFDKPYIAPKIQKSVPTPQTTTYRNSLAQQKNTYNHITRTYIENIYKIQTYLNKNPRATNIKEPNTDYITQHLQGYNKLIALPGTNTNLITTCYNYGLLSTVYTATGDEISKIPELYKAFLTYKRITKGTLFFVKFYTATAEILYDEIKPVIQVIKIGLTRDMLIPEKIEKQNEISIVDIPDFYANKRVIGIATILTELANNYLNNNTIWSYYSRDNTMIYSNCRETREGDMKEIRQWILSLLKPENIPTTRAIRKNFISPTLLTRYCTTISNKYSEHICSKCQGEDNNVPTVQLE